LFRASVGLSARHRHDKTTNVALRPPRPQRDAEPTVARKYTAKAKRAELLRLDYTKNMVWLPLSVTVTDSLVSHAQSGDDVRVEFDGDARGSARRCGWLKDPRVAKRAEPTTSVSIWVDDPFAHSGDEVLRRWSDLTIVEPPLSGSRWTPHWAVRRARRACMRRVCRCVTLSLLPHAQDYQLDIFDRLPTLAHFERHLASPAAPADASAEAAYRVLCCHSKTMSKFSSSMLGLDGGGGGDDDDEKALSFLRSFQRLCVRRCVLVVV
jgi:hypothetical protein